MFLSKTENILRNILTHGHLHHLLGDTSCLSPSKLSGSTLYFTSSLFKPFIEAASLLLVIVTKALQPFLTWRRKCLLADHLSFLSTLPSLCVNSRQDAADISPLSLPFLTLSFSFCSLGHKDQKHNTSLGGFQATAL